MFFLFSRGFTEMLNCDCKSKKFIKPKNNFTKIKLLRAYSGCLGTRRRRRTRLPAISGGELDVSFDPSISEWGNPA